MGGWHGSCICNSHTRSHGMVLATATVMPYTEVHILHVLPRAPHWHGSCMPTMPHQTPPWHASCYCNSCTVVLACFVLLQPRYLRAGTLLATAQPVPHSSEISVPTYWHTSCSLDQGAHIDCGKMPQCGKMPHLVCQAHERGRFIPVSLPVQLPIRTPPAQWKGCKSFTFKRIDLQDPQSPQGAKRLYTQPLSYI